MTEPDLILDLDDVGALLLLLGLGAAVYYGDDSTALETRKLLDRIPTEHLTAAMRKFAAAADRRIASAEAATEGSDAG